jgi:hypothetical protein
MALSKLLGSNTAWILETSALVIAASLVFAVPFGPSRNTDMQGLLLLISGCLAWLAILLGKDRSWPLDKLTTALMAIFFTGCLVVTISTPHLEYNLLGAPYIRLGSLGFLACLGIALLTLRHDIQSLLRIIYALVFAVAVLSLPYAWLKGSSLGRIGGTFYQADILAIFLGCALLIGGYLRQHETAKWRLKLTISQLFLAFTLVLTGTRAVLLLIIFLYPGATRQVD